MHPGQADHVAAAEGLDSHPALTGHGRVEHHLTSIDDPEPACR
jgi:hypothetical protein